MSAWRLESDALLAELLGEAGLDWIAWDAPPPGRRPIAVSLVGLDPAPDERQRVFASLATALSPGRVLIVADHNRPRRFVDALVAVVASPRVPGSTLRERWKRLGRPTAREVQGAGFRVEKLRLAAGERVQIVVAIRS